MAVTGDELNYYAIVATILSAGVIAGLLEIRYLVRIGLGIHGKIYGTLMGALTWLGAISLASIPGYVLGHANYWSARPDVAATIAGGLIATIIGFPVGLAISLAWRGITDPVEYTTPQAKPKRESSAAPAPAPASTSAAWAVVALLGAAVAYVVGRGSGRESSPRR